MTQCIALDALLVSRCIALVAGAMTYSTRCRRRTPLPEQRAEGHPSEVVDQHYERRQGGEKDAAIGNLWQVGCPEQHDRTFHSRPGAPNPPLVSASCQDDRGARPEG